MQGKLKELIYIGHGGLSEGDMFVLGLQGSLPTWHFQAKVGTRHSSQRKQTASQYYWVYQPPSMWSAMGKNCRTARHRGTPWLLWACGLERRQKRQVPQCTGLGQLPALVVSFLLSLPASDHRGPQSWLCKSVGLVSSSFLVGNTHIRLFFFVPTALSWLRLISEMSVCNNLLTSFLASDLLL